jgi:hypothetical protein
MTQRSIEEIAGTFGLTIETMAIPENENAFRVFKGARQVFIGSEEAVRNFLGSYDRERPALYEGSMYGYQE